MSLGGLGFLGFLAFCFFSINLVPTIKRQQVPLFWAVLDGSQICGVSIPKEVKRLLFKGAMFMEPILKL